MSYHSTEPVVEAVDFHDITEPPVIQGFAFSL